MDITHLKYLHMQVLNYAKLQTKDFYVYSWLFIKRVLNSNDSSLEENVNVNLINNSIDNKVLRGKLHEIRIERNRYEHMDFENGVSMNVTLKDIKSHLLTLNELVDYVNDRLQLNLDVKFNLNTKLEFVADNIDSVEAAIGINNEKQKRYVVYDNGYTTNSNPFDIVINGELDFNNNKSLYAVIHNFLIRSKVVKKSNFLNSKKLHVKQLEKVYVYEILILNAIRYNYLSYKTSNTISVNIKDKELSEIALMNIEYYFNILMKITTKQNPYRIKIDNISSEDSGKDIDKIHIIVNNNEKITAEYLINDEVNKSSSHVWISSKVDYKINKSNIKYYNSLLEDLLGIVSFREGQVEVFNHYFNRTSDINMVILPTSYGKSLIYQFITILQPTVSIIVSPTEELIRDQILNLRLKGYENVEKFSITTELRRVLDASRNKSEMINDIFSKSTMIYATPEILQTESHLELIAALDRYNLITAISIDECHHLSSLGHQFNAQFFTLAKQINDVIDNTQILLFSATAAKKVILDIKNQFIEKKFNVINPVPINRGNIKYSLYSKDDIKEITQHVAKIFNENYDKNNLFDCSRNREIPSLTLIVNNTREVLEFVYEELSKSDKIRDNVCLYYGENDIYDKFRCANKTIMLTTDQYLCGININHLKNIIIIGMPPSKEWLYQNSGRVGRVGEKSNVLMYLFEKNSELYNEIVFDKLNLDIYIEKLSDRVSIPADISNFSDIIFDYFNAINRRKLIFELYGDIKNKTHYPNNGKIGRIRGFLYKSDKDKYFYELFILFKIGLIISWQFRDEINERAEFAFKIMDEDFIDKSNITLLIEQFSVNSSIKEESLHKLQEVKCYIGDSIGIIDDWYTKNSYQVKRQMILNVSEMLNTLKYSSEVDSVKVEQNLAMYFSVNEPYIASIEECEEFANNSQEAIYKVEKSVSSEKVTEEQLPKDVNCMKEVAITKEEVREFNNEKINGYNYSINESYLNYIKDACKDGSKLISSIELNSIIMKLHDECYEKQIFYKSYFERELENYYNINYDVILTLLDLSAESTNGLTRLENLFYNKSIKSHYKILRIIEKNISFEKGYEINKILKNYSLEKLYNRDFVGRIKEVFFSLKDKAN